MVPWAKFLQVSPIKREHIKIRNEVLHPCICGWNMLNHAWTTFSFLFVSLEKFMHTWFWTNDIFHLRNMELSKWNSYQVRTDRFYEVGKYFNAPEIDMYFKCSQMTWMLFPRVFIENVFVEELFSKCPFK